MSVRFLVACAALLSLSIVARGSIGQRLMHADERAVPRVEIIVVSGGCYFTRKAAFEHVRGMTDGVSGIAGREAGTAAYARNPTDTVGLAEVVRITYDPEAVSLAELPHVLAAMTLEREGRRSVAAQVAALADFRPVVESEQEFVEKNPGHPYVIECDRPKLKRFRRVLPELYRKREGASDGRGSRPVR